MHSFDYRDVIICLDLIKVAEHPLFSSKVIVESLHTSKVRQ